MKFSKIKPMNGLCNNDQVECAVGEIGMFCGLDRIVNINMLLRLINLYLADIRSIDPIERFTELTGNLAISGSTIPSRLLMACQGKNIGKQFFRIMWSIFSVLIRIRGKVIFHVLDVGVFLNFKDTYFKYY